MKTIEYWTIDKTSWGNGDWNKGFDGKGEPDKRQWEDEHTGLPCLIVRNHHGSLCGYVGVSQGHPFFKKGGYDFDLEVHGGITFTGGCDSNYEPSMGICHIDPSNDNVWWLGFDCGHFMDVSPAMAARLKIVEDFPAIDFAKCYRNIDYVTAEVQSLAKQLKALEKPVA